MISLEGGRSPRPAVLIAAALAAVATAYSPVTVAPFVWDDWPLIVDQPLVHEIRPRSLILEPFWAASPTGARDAPYYRPVVALSYSVDWVAGGGRPARFHLVNLLAHLGVTLLVFSLARRGGASPVAAALGSALFGLAPRLSESVAWISGRTDLLAALFALLALRVHGDSEPRRWLAAVLLILGLLSKEVAIAGLAGLAAWEWARSARGETTGRSALRNLLPALTAAVAYASLRWLALTSASTPSRSTPGDPETRVALALEAVGRYSTMIGDPLRPALQIGWRPTRSPALVVLGAFVLAAGVVLATRALRRPPRPGVAQGMALFAGGIAPVLHLVPLALVVVAADRFLYLPLAGLAVAGSVASDRVPQRLGRAAATIAVALALASGLATYHRAVLWQQEIPLWEDTVRTTSPVNPVPLAELGSALARADRAEEALVWYRRALANTPRGERPTALSNVATALSNVGRPDEGLPLMMEVLRLEPNLPQNHFNLGIMLARHLRFDEAEASLRRALQLAPRYADAQAGLQFVARARETWSQLRPETEAAPREIRVAWAHFWNSLGDPRRSAAAWAGILRSPEATLEDVRAGALVTVRSGSADEARTAMAAARRLGAPAAVVVELEGLMRNRFANRDRSAPGGAP